MSCEASSCILGKKKIGYHLTVPLTIHSYITIRSIYEVEWCHQPISRTKLWLFLNALVAFAMLLADGLSALQNRQFCLFTYLHTYIHNWPLWSGLITLQSRIQPFSRPSFSHHLCCLTPIPNDRFFLRKFSWQFYLFLEFLPEIFWEEVAEEIFCHILTSDDWPGIRTQAFELLDSLHTTDWEDNHKN